MFNMYGNKITFIDFSKELIFLHETITITYNISKAILKQKKTRNVKL